MMGMRNIAVITARGGSKRIPKKNIKDFYGVPIISYSIKAAIESNLFEEIMVSTDDDEIAEISKSFGAKVPFFRSKINSGDHATTADVLIETIQEYMNAGKIYDNCCCIYPTAPFISSTKLLHSYNHLINSSADSVMPVVKFNYPIQRALKIIDGKLEMVNCQNLELRSQDLIPTYHDVGQFYWFKCNRFMEKRNILTDKTIPFELEECEVQDIDTESDWLLAEIKYEKMTRIEDKHVKNK